MNIEPDWITIGIAVAIGFITTRLHPGAHAMQILEKAGARMGKPRDGARFRATAGHARVGKAHLEGKLVVTFYDDGIGLGTTEGVGEAFLPFEDLVQTGSFTFPLLYRGPRKEVAINLGLKVPLPAEIRTEVGALGANAKH